jgi:hypothetical protein
MESSLETVALFSLKLAYETEGHSPILRKDLVMSDYQKEVFGLLVRQGDVSAIQQKVEACVGLALQALGGVDRPLGRELQKLAVGFRSAGTVGELDAPLAALKGYLRDIQ